MHQATTLFPTIRMLLTVPFWWESGTMRMVARLSSDLMSRATGPTPSRTGALKHTTLTVNPGVGNGINEKMIGTAVS